MCSSDIFLGVLAILFPPLPVWVKCGLCSADSIINILLCLLGYIPGTIHAWYIIAKFPDTDEYERVPQDYEHGHGGGSTRVEYVFIQAPHAPCQPGQAPQPQQQQPKQGPPTNYGTVSTNDNNNNAAGSSSRQNEASGSADNGDHAPPTYAEAVKGDHKIQSDD